MSHDPQDAIAAKIIELEHKIAVGEKSIASMRETLEKYRTAQKVLSEISDVPTTRELRTANRNLRELELQIAEAIPAMLVDYPKGVAVSDLVTRFGATDYDVRAAVRALVAQKKIIQYLRRDTAAKLYIVDGHIPPPEELTAAQSKMLTYLKANADTDGLCRASLRELSKKCAISLGSVSAVRDALEAKGHIDVTVRGRGTTVNTMQIVNFKPAFKTAEDYEEFADG